MKSVQILMGKKIVTGIVEGQRTKQRTTKI